jgi:[protein-PII] uridylyltransferase
MATLVEVRAADGIGVLARITDAIAGCDVRVEQAYVSTLGHEVVDTFYVTTPGGEKVTEPAVLRALVGALSAALGATTGDPSGSGHADDQLR